ncbi:MULTISPECIES: hypothetical protein [Bacillota]|uniref:hypothetical protein n=1 Tax=Bacillota TaxID=1239 RepID=UPI00232B1951|nr:MULTISPECIES: hypothetical protein [Bacillota]MDB2104999.1 hypothetical protein [Clostridium paraputrificum]MDU2107960.1 hypothetical protein [Clostridium sp.]MDU3355908.1 hypothetical protein [Clostridium sp.]MDU4728154.1 hypothetical protein [Clostridium sp.]MDU5512396.1 hypothetical protein [Enterococcus gilvus]
MKAKRLKELLETIDDNTEIFIRNTVNICGNISELEQVEESSYGFFGKSISCVILNTSNSKEIELDDNDEIIDFIKSE